jgi:aminopeptidase-like protein
MKFYCDIWTDVQSGTSVHDWIMDPDTDFWFVHNGHDFAYVSDYDGKEVIMYQNKQTKDFAALELSKLKMYDAALLTTFNAYKTLLGK